MSLTSADVDLVREIVRQRSAIVIDESKAYLVESRLGPVARQAGLTSTGHLIEQLRRNANGPLRDLVVDAMTTNETSFFRDLHPWDALRAEIMPQLAERRQVQRTLTFWSAACSSGQEPYSLAMLLLEHFRTLVTSWNVRIIATDLSSEMLGRAAAGRFSQLEVNRGLPTPLLVRYFRREGSQFQVSDEVRQMVEFRALNLAEPWPFVPPVDVLFMRNVLIYFDVETKRRILARVREVLRPDGFLFLGSAETTLNLDQSFRRVQAGRATVYQPAPA